MSAVHQPELDAPIPPAKRDLPDRVHGLFLLPALIRETKTGPIFKVVRAINNENKRAGKAYWSFAQYERLFAAAQTDEKKSLFILNMVFHTKRRYDAARKAGLSEWQFAEQERRYHESIDQHNASIRIANAAQDEKRKGAEYQGLVAAEAAKIRARNEARDLVAAERGPSTPRIGGKRPARPLPDDADLGEQPF